MTYYEPWTEQATCRSVGGGLWFPESGESSLEPRQICLNRCTVRTQCLDFAMRKEQGLSKVSRHGLFGGMSPTARAKYEPQWLAEQEGVSAA